MRGVLRFLATLIIGWAASVTFAFDVRVAGASVYVNEVLVLTLKAGNNEQRAHTVANSFRKLTPASELKLEGNSRAMRVIDGDRVVLTIARLEAKAQGMSVADLSKLWTASLRKAIALPPIVLPSDTLKLPLGANRAIDLAGSLLNKVQVATDDAKVVTATRAGAKLTVNAKSYGSATLTLTAGAAVKTLRVHVLPFAAELPQTITMAVTGDPALSETVRGAIENALWNQFTSIPGTNATFKMPEVTSILPEQGKTFSVPVKVTGEQAFPVEGTINVVVRNEAVAYRAESELWYCNDPENVVRYQNLFGSELSSAEPVRLLYHHLNAMGTSILVDGRIINESDKPARLLILPGDKRDKNPVLAGLMAGDQLLRNWVRFSGEIITVPARSSVCVALRKLAPQETMSGLAYLRLLPGGPPKLLFRVDSEPVVEGDERLSEALNTAPWRRLMPSPIQNNERSRVVFSKHIYPYPFKTEEVDYSVGGRHRFIRIGQKPIPRPNGKGLDGNFGVFYTVDARIENPLSEPADVELVFEASAGYSGALFIYNGEVKRTPLLQPKEELQILKFRMQPGEKRQISFMTVPLSGSSYPATLVLRPVGLTYRIPR